MRRSQCDFLLRFVFFGNGENQRDLQTSPNPSICRIMAALEGMQRQNIRRTPPSPLEVNLK